MIVDLYGGPGGWDVACTELGLDPIGIEYERWACATRAAAGFTTIQADVSTIDPARFAACTGLIASPPCQGFSSAGKGAARDLIPELAESIRARRWDDRADPDPRVWLIVDLGRWLEQLDPDWIALEQVPAVLPLWRAYADMLRERGYSTWCGLLNAADFGVPQTRTRAILMASKGRIAHPPEPTHAREPVDSLFGTTEPWVTMAEALGWGMTARPSVTVMAGQGRGGGACPLDGGSRSRATLAGEQAAGRFVPGMVVRTSIGEPKDDPQNGHHTLDPAERPAHTVTTKAGDWLVGFPRADDTGTSEDGYRDRDWRSGDEPAFVVTEKARSWIIKQAGEPEPLEPGDDWVVATGMNSMSVSRDPQDMQPYERSIDEPAPTLGTMAGGQWTVGPPGHRQPPMRWKVEYRRGGDRIHEGIDPETEPAQTLTGRADRWQVNTGRAWAKGGDRDDAQEVDASAEPAPTITAKSGGQWQIRNTSQEHATVRGEDEPAPTLHFGHTPNTWVFERPATTVMGDPRTFQPGGHHTPGAQSENSIRLTIRDALLLQSFPEDFPMAGSKTAQFTQVGNAIPPLLAWHILRQLV